MPLSIVKRDDSAAVNLNNTLFIGSRRVNDQSSDQNKKHPLTTFAINTVRQHFEFSKQPDRTKFSVLRFSLRPGSRIFTSTSDRGSSTLLFSTSHLFFFFLTKKRILQKRHTKNKASDPDPFVFGLLSYGTQTSLCIPKRILFSCSI